MDENKFKHKVIQTYAEDMAKVIQADQSGSTVRNIIHSEEEAEARKKITSPESVKNKLFILSSVGLIVAGVVTLVFFGMHRVTPVVKEVAVNNVAPILFTDKTSFVSVDGITKDQIAQNMKIEVEKTAVKTNGAVAIYFTENKKTIGLREFLYLIKSTFVTDSTDFVSDGFMMGFVQGDPKKDLFMLIKMRSLPDIFENMKAWEKKMFSELSPFFYVDHINDPTLTTKVFEDGIIENKNARILYDSTGAIALMYIYADDNSVVITNSLATAHEVMARLNASRVQK